MGRADHAAMASLHSGLAMQPKPLVIGLTGGIGSGKTAASDHFARLGITVVDADVVARQVVEPGSNALAQIAQHFGQHILNAEGCLDRAALRDLVFQDPKQKQWLEALLHPIIRLEIQRQLASATSSYVLLVSPLLFETGQDQLVDRSLLIDAPEALQIDRACARDTTEESKIAAIIASQMPRIEKRKRADDLITNDKSLDDLYAAVHRMHVYYRELAHDQTRFST